MLFISDIVEDLIQNAVKEVEDCPECPCCMEKLFTPAKGIKGVLGLCEHWVCLSCYEHLRTKTCPLCRADYKDIDKDWYVEMVDIKLTIGSLSRKKFNEEEKEDWCVDKECEECAHNYSYWKNELISNETHIRTKELSPKSIIKILHSYGYAKAKKEHINMWGDCLVTRRCCGIKINNPFQIFCSCCKNEVSLTEEQERVLLYNLLAQKLRDFFDAN